MVRQIFSSGYCFIIPDEDERILIKEYNDEEFLKLGVDRIPAKNDIRYYDKFDRCGNVIEKNHFIVEEIISIDVIDIKKHSGYDESNTWKEDIDAMIKVKYNNKLFKLRNPVIWEESSTVLDTNNVK